MGLRSAGRLKCRWVHDEAGSNVTVVCAGSRLRPHTSGGNEQVAGAGIALRHVAVRRNLAGGERYALRPAALAQSKARAYMDGNATLEVWQGKSVPVRHLRMWFQSN